MSYSDLITRDQLIAKYVEENASATVDELVEKFTLSHSTIRRILYRLAEVGVVERTHGGASWMVNDGLEMPVFSRAKVHSQQKNNIAEVAASLVANNETIILLAGTTTNAMSAYLKDKSGLKIITNSLPVLTGLNLCMGVEVIFLGGNFNRREQSVGGYLTSLCAKELSADKLFFGIRGITADYRLTLDDINERDTFKIFMESARESIVLSDSSKFSQSGTIALCQLEQINSLITDENAPAAMLDEIRQKGLTVHIASPA